MRIRANKAACVALIALALTACRRATVIHAYRDTPAGGWEQSDALVFPIDTLRESGTYDLSVGVRTTNGYPYARLWLVVDTRLANPDTAFADTLQCSFVDERGVRNGDGVDTYQYVFPLRRLTLSAGQSGDFRIHHIMRREILPGISDIGVRLAREQQ